MYIENSGAPGPACLSNIADAETRLGKKIALGTVVSNIDRADNELTTDQAPALHETISAGCFFLNSYL